MSDLLHALLLLVCLGALFGAANLWRRRGRAPAEWTRKLIHVAGAVTGCALPYLLGSPWSAAALGLVVAVLLRVGRRGRVLPALHGVERLTDGDLCLVAAVVLLFPFGRSEPSAHLGALLVMGLGDAAAALVGTALRPAGRRTAAGSVTMFVVSFVGLWVVFLAAGAGWAEALIWALLGGVCATSVEAVAPGGSDNLLVPLAVFAVLTAPMGTAVVFTTALSGLAAVIRRPRLPFHAAWCLAVILAAREAGRRAAPTR